ncbi:MAG TPA: hypothetical protein VM784_04775 [Actinomycetota bacterium]|nr:hypothetical protein [Actinomycetota bacterium]
MSALAYLLPPLSGLVALFGGKSARARFHGLQSIAFGAAWPAILWACSFVSTGATQVAFALGILLWVVLMGAAAFGRDLRLPFLGRFLVAAAEVPPTGAP